MPVIFSGNFSCLLRSAISQLLAVATIPLDLTFVTLVSPASAPTYVFLTCQISHTISIMTDSEQIIDRINFCGQLLPYIVCTIHVHSCLIHQNDLLHCFSIKLFIFQGGQKREFTQRMDLRTQSPTIGCLSLDPYDIASYFMFCITAMTYHCLQKSLQFIVYFSYSVMAGELLLRSLVHVNTVCFPVKL